LPELSPRRGNDPVPVAEVQQWLAQGDALIAALPPTVEMQAGGRLLELVLRRWDFRQEDGWRAVLDRLAPGGVLAERERIWIEEVLRRLAGTEIVARLRRARRIRRDVEYLTAAREGPGVVGRIDCLWLDEPGRWNLLFWVTDPIPEAAREACWREREAAVVLAATALREQTGEWPRGAALVLVREGAAIERAPARLAHRRLLAEVGHGLGEIAARAVLG
jgi:hypothetical protein